MDEGFRIKKRREELGMSQDELAKRTGYKSRSSINKIELGYQHLTQRKILLFANALNVSVNYILGIEGAFDENRIVFHSVNLEERDLILAYRRADDATKQIIRKILDMDLPAEKRNESIS